MDERMYQTYYAIRGHHVETLTDGLLRERWFIMYRGKQIGTLYHLSQGEVNKIIRVLNDETIWSKIGLTFSFLHRRKKSKFSLNKFLGHLWHRRPYDIR
jgi:hypothetical protein